MTDAPVVFLPGMPVPRLCPTTSARYVVATVIADFAPTGVPEYIPSGDAQPCRLEGI